MNIFISAPPFGLIGNKSLIITGYTKTKMEKLLLNIKEILQLKTGPKFGNKKSISHYEPTPQFYSDNNVKNYSQSLRTNISQGIAIC